ncbi:hypothetical protein GDO81_024181 [Engystomops pustulosus]|uniref:Uncharacterized protein n=1 Tax=Engystomops pustulosus TaxID=76066 RepID=A0AAV6Z5G4_ENGPU|nr:hypothetical protein GDO81_024181 [Engystomops pustulosus]
MYKDRTRHSDRPKHARPRLDIYRHRTRQVEGRGRLHGGEHTVYSWSTGPRGSTAPGLGGATTQCTPTIQLWPAEWSQIRIWHLEKKPYQMSS